MEKEVLLQKLGTLLKRMDEFDGDKALSDAAATLDDVILLIDESDPQEEDWPEVMEDALAELADLCGEIAQVPGAFSFSEKLKDVIREVEK